MIKSKCIKPFEQKQLKSTCYCLRYWCITTGSAKGAIPKVRPFPLARCCNREGPAADRAPEMVSQRPPALSPSTPGNHLNPPKKTGKLLGTCKNMTCSWKGFVKNHGALQNIYFYQMTFHAWTLQDHPAAHCRQARENRPHQNWIKTARKQWSIYFFYK